MNCTRHKLRNETTHNKGGWITADVQDSHTCTDSMHRLTSVQPSLNTHFPPSNSSPLTPGATSDCLLCFDWPSSETTAFSSSWIWLCEALSKCLCGLIPCFSNGSAMEKKSISKCPTNTTKCHSIIVSVHACAYKGKCTHTHRSGKWKFQDLSFASARGKKHFLLSRLFHLELHSFFFLFFFSEFALQFSRASSWFLERVRAGVQWALSICEPD